MAKITIVIVDEQDDEEYPISREEVIKHVVELIDQGYTSGYDPYWYWSMTVEEDE